MSSRHLTITLTAFLFVVLMLIVATFPNPTQLNWEFLPEMNRSPAIQAFEVTAEFGNGRAQQSIVAGTIPRGHMPLHFKSTKEDALRAGEELFNPYQQHLPVHSSSTSDAAAEDPAVIKQALLPSLGDQPKPDPQVELTASAQRGEAVYRVYCASCHGTGGAGNGPVAQRGFPPPPPLPTGKSVQMKDGQLFHILTFGQGSMASMAAQLDPDQRWDVINYVRTLQQAARTPSSSPAAEPVTTPPTPQPVRP